MSANMKKPRTKYLSEVDVLAIHKALVAFFQDSDPIEPAGPRDGTLLGSACGRPQTAMGDTEKYPSIEAKAAALFHSLVKNHPFHNGNKRTALVATIVFLDDNKRRLRSDVTDDEIFDFVTRVASNDFPASEHGLGDDALLREIARWVGVATTPRDPSPRTMRITDFIAKSQLAGAKVKKAEGGWVVQGTNGSSIRIAGSTKKLDGPAVKNYVSKLGLSGAGAGVYIDEFQAGVPAEQVTILRLRNVLRRLANA